MRINRQGRVPCDHALVHIAQEPIVTDAAALGYDKNTTLRSGIEGDMRHGRQESQEHGQDEQAEVSEEGSQALQEVARDSDRTPAAARRFPIVSFASRCVGP
jgi:hypothetical protein